jgi:hypothetical protein
VVGSREWGEESSKVDMDNVYSNQSTGSFRHEVMVGNTEKKCHLETSEYKIFLLISILLGE